MPDEHRTVVPLTQHDDGDTTDDRATATTGPENTTPTGTPAIPDGGTSTPTPAADPTGTDGAANGEREDGADPEPDRQPERDGAGGDEPGTEATNSRTANDQGQQADPGNQNEDGNGSGNGNDRENGNQYGRGNGDGNVDGDGGGGVKFDEELHDVRTRQLKERTNLSDRQAEVVAAKQLGLSHAEIAAYLDVQKGVVDKHSSRARKKLVAAEETIERARREIEEAKALMDELADVYGEDAS